jgi:hypothetical protein
MANFFREVVSPVKVSTMLEPRSKAVLDAAKAIPVGRWNAVHAELAIVQIFIARALVKRSRPFVAIPARSGLLGHPRARRRLRIDGRGG